MKSGNEDSYEILQKVFYIPTVRNFWNLHNMQTMTIQISQGGWSAQFTWNEHFKTNACALACKWVIMHVVFCSGYKSYVQSLNQDTSDCCAMLHASFFLSTKFPNLEIREVSLQCLRCVKTALYYSLNLHGNSFIFTLLYGHHDQSNGISCITVTPFEMQRE